MALTRDERELKTQSPNPAPDTTDAWKKGQGMRQGQLSKRHMLSERQRDTRRSLFQSPNGVEISKKNHQKSHNNGSVPHLRLNLHSSYCQESARQETHIELFSARTERKRMKENEQRSEKCGTPSSVPLYTKWKYQKEKRVEGAEKSI